MRSTNTTFGHSSTHHCQNPCPDRPGQARPGGGQLGKLRVCRCRGVNYGVNLPGTVVLLGDIRIWQRIARWSADRTVTGLMDPIGAIRGKRIVGIGSWCRLKMDPPAGLTPHRSHGQLRKSSAQSVFNDFRVARIDWVLHVESGAYPFRSALP